jgi:predicted nucleotidyltransferase component of viral defense system
LGIEIQARLTRIEAVNPIYLDTARLLTRVAPLVFADGIFALKGGTAINLFFRDMPRLSVDLDLVFVDHRMSREKALSSINTAIRKAAERLETSGFNVRVATAEDAGETKLFVRRENIVVKAEVNFVMRGSVYPVRTLSLTPSSRLALLADLELPILSNEDVYGSKLVAAMDRQHPRDLFDVQQLYANEGITPGIRRCFVIYLACHNRPMHEVLFPAQKDIAQEYERTFLGMTAEPIKLAALLSTRERLMADVQSSLTMEERRFLISLANAEPDWSQLEVEHLEHLPAIRWKLRNLRHLAVSDPKKLRFQADELERRLQPH